MPIMKKCVVCEGEFSVPPNRAETAKACSNECAVQVRAKSRERKVQCKCMSCGKFFQVPKSHVGRKKYCSLGCRNGSSVYAETISQRVLGERNPMWKGGLVGIASGYIARLLPEHHFASRGYVLEHRNVMEQWLRECCPDSKFLIEVNGKLYVSPEFEVHHLDEVKTNNVRSNLLVCTKQTHKSLHAGYGVNSGTFWPELASIPIDETPPEEAQRARRKAQRLAKRNLKLKE